MKMQLSLTVLVASLLIGGTLFAKDQDKGPDHPTGHERALESGEGKKKGLHKQHGHEGHDHEAEKSKDEGDTIVIRPVPEPEDKKSKPAPKSTDSDKAETEVSRQPQPTRERDGDWRSQPQTR